MQNDSIETLLLRHLGNAAPVPAGLEQQLRASVRSEARAEQTRQQAANRWNEQRVSRRKVLQLVTFTSAGVGALAVGLNAIQSKPERPAYSF